MELKRFLNILVIMYVFSMYAQDDWSGTYVIKSTKSVVEDTVKISTTTDLNKKDATAKYYADLKRWIIQSKRDNYEDKIEVRRFLFNEENNEYKQFGWTDLHKKGEMKCIDAHHFFVCKTAKNTKVTFPDGETFISKRGLFGIMLHYGLFDLEKVK